MLNTFREIEIKLTELRFLYEKCRRTNEHDDWKRMKSKWKEIKKLIKAVDDNDEISKDDFDKMMGH